MSIPLPFKLKEDVVPYTEFRASLSSFMAQTRRTHRPILVTQKGKSAAVLLDAADFDDLREQLAIAEDIRSAEAELDRGEALSPAEVLSLRHARQHTAPGNFDT